ncbi:hypothetical protein Tco_0351094 [Tanacetum coccineum]
MRRKVAAMHVDKERDSWVKRMSSSEGPENTSQPLQARRKTMTESRNLEKDMRVGGLKVTCFVVSNELVFGLHKLEIEEHLRLFLRDIQVEQDLDI